MNVINGIGLIPLSLTHTSCADPLRLHLYKERPSKASNVSLMILIQRFHSLKDYSLHTQVSPRSYEYSYKSQ